MRNNSKQVRETLFASFATLNLIGVFREVP
jgi:hypothetical protein